MKMSLLLRQQQRTIVLKEETHCQSHSNKINLLYYECMQNYVFFFINSTQVYYYQLPATPCPSLGRWRRWYNNNFPRCSSYLLIIWLQHMAVGADDLIHITRLHPFSYAEQIMIGSGQLAYFTSSFLWGIQSAYDFVVVVVALRGSTTRFTTSV